MKIVETKDYILDEEDKRLLSIEIPDDPCNKCGFKGCCCGCNESKEYIETIKSYKDRNIFEIAVKLKRIQKLQNEIIKNQKEINKISEELKNIGL